MTSKRHVREHQCGQKRQFDTLDEARRMAWFQRRRSGERWSAYRCKWCRFAHIGHGR